MPPTGLATGAFVGEYKVVRLIGAGGMGLVYEGVHPLLERKVAIKVIAGEVAQSGDAAARFLQEARAASGLRHRNIVDVFAFGRLPDGRYYQVMELIEGDTLRALIAKHAPLRLDLVRAVARGLLSAIDAAARHGIIHRDIKPENIFVEPAPGGPPDEVEIKVLDFGLAKRTGHDPDHLVKSRTGIPMGTPAYMSPEQCRAVRPVDTRTDLYAVGIVLFEMLTGKVPFMGESALDIMTQQIGIPPPPLSSLAEVPRDVEAVVIKALAKSPDDRFQTAADMLGALETACRDALAGGAPTTPPTLLRRAPTTKSRVGATDAESPATAADKATPGGSAGARPAYVTEGPPTAATITSLSPTVTPARPYKAVSQQPRASQPPKRAALGVGILALVAAAAIALSSRQRGTPSPALVAPTAQEAAARYDSAVRTYLAEAERLLRERKVGQAERMLEQARALKVDDPSLTIRYTRLASEANEARVAIEVERARKLLESGDPAGAVDAAKKALDRNPESAEATQLLDQARGVRDPTTAAQEPILAKSDERPRDTGDRKRVQGRGTLSVRSTPPGMVYLDDMRIGYSPIRRLAVASGAHALQIRFRGHRPFEEKIQIKADAHFDRGDVRLLPESTPTDPEAASDDIAVPTRGSGPRRAERTGLSAQPASALAAKPGSSGSHRLPRVYEATSHAELGQACADVEREAVALGGLSPDFARGITGPLVRAASGGGPVKLYPASMYALIVTEAARGRDKAATAEALRRSHVNGDLRRINARLK